MKDRIRSCLKEIKKEHLDGLLLSNPVNITYLTGFREAQGYLLLTCNQKLVYFTHPLYCAEARRLPWEVVPRNGNILILIAKKISNLKLKKIGFESKHLPYLEYRKINEHLLAKNIEFKVTSDLVARLRTIKERGEIALIKKSLKITQEALEFTSQIHDKSMTEKQMRIEIEKFLKLKGDNEIAFGPIVAAGKNSALPHYLCGNKRLNKGLVLVDLGSKYQGYCADLTRVFFWGKMPNLMRKIYDIVRKAQELSIKKIRAGAKANEIDRAARNYIAKKGFAKYFIHNTGHGLGLEVHEPPYLNSKNETRLKEGMVLTVEPGIYLPGKFGIRIEDMVLVKKGNAEVLSGDTYW
ncbi:MAG: aminopeptidase P family protein [Candidatus Omnitrophota bacterium]|nr:MAG: aminopeptidase P family protein [Candidatus Omnitrophota bacterium]